MRSLHDLDPARWAWAYWQGANGRYLFDGMTHLTEIIRQHIPYPLTGTEQQREMRRYTGNLWRFERAAAGREVTLVALCGPLRSQARRPNIVAASDWSNIHECRVCAEQAVALGLTDTPRTDPTLYLNNANANDPWNTQRRIDHLQPDPVYGD